MNTPNSQGSAFNGQSPSASEPNLLSNLSTWMQMSSMVGLIVTDGCSIHVTNWCKVSGYGGLGPGGHFTCPFIAASCRLPPCSPSEYSNGDTPYLQPHAIPPFNNIINHPVGIARWRTCDLHPHPLSKLRDLSSPQPSLAKKHIFLRYSEIQKEPYILLKAGGKLITYIIAYRVHPSAHISVRSSILASLGQSHSSGALKGAVQCCAAHSCRVSIQGQHGTLHSIPH